MTQPPQNNNPYPVPGPNGQPVQPAPAANGYQAPNVNGMPSYPGQQGFMPAQAVAPDAEEKLKRSQLVLLATAGSYVIATLVAYFMITAPMLGESASFGLVGSLFVTVVVLGLFALVYILMSKHKVAGRITGYVFASLGAITASLNFISTLMWGQVIAVFYLIWLALGVTWIIFVSNKSVSSILR